MKEIATRVAKVLKLALAGVRVDQLNLSQGRAARFRTARQRLLREEGHANLTTFQKQTNGEER